MEKIAVFAGTFDPFTLGHFEIVERARKVFDKVIVAIADDAGSKKCKFNAKNRLKIAKKSLENMDRVDIVIFKELLVDFMKENNITTLVRGLRNTIDFEYEKTLFNAYKSQYDEIESYYLICSSEYSHISSSLVREVLAFDGDIEKYVCASALPLIK